MAGEAVIVADLLTGVGVEPGAIQKLDSQITKALSDLSKHLTINVPVTVGGSGPGSSGTPRLPPQLLTDIQKLSNEAATLRNQFQAGLIGPTVVTELQRVASDTRVLAGNFELGSKEARQLSLTLAQTERTIAGVSGETTRLGIASQLTTGIMGSLKSILATIGVGAGIYGLQQIGTGLQNMALEAAKATASTRLYQQQVQIAGADSSTAAKLVDELATKYRVMPSVVQESTTQLLRNGATLEDVRKILEGGAASALAFGKDVKSGFENVTQATVSLTSAQLNQIGISENIAPALDKYAKSLGTTADSLTRAQQTQAVANLVMKATGQEIKSVDVILGGYIGSQANANLAMQKFAQTLGAQVQPVFTLINNSAAGFLKFLGDSPGVLAGFAAAAATAATALGAFKLSEIVSGLGGLIPALTAARTAMLTTFAAGGPIALGIIAVSATVGLLIANYIRLQEESRKFQEQVRKEQDIVAKGGANAKILIISRYQTQYENEAQRLTGLRAESEAKIAALKKQSGDLALIDLKLEQERLAAIIKAQEANQKRLTDNTTQLAIAKKELEAEEKKTAAVESTGKTIRELLPEAERLAKALRAAQAGTDAAAIADAQAAIDAFTKANANGAAAISAVTIALNNQNKAIKQNTKDSKDAANDRATIAALENEAAFRAKLTQAIQDQNLKLLGLLETQYKADQANARAKGDLDAYQLAASRLAETQAAIARATKAASDAQTAFWIAAAGGPLAGQRQAARGLENPTTTITQTAKAAQVAQHAVTEAITAVDDLSDAADTASDSIDDLNIRLQDIPEASGGIQTAETEMTAFTDAMRSAVQQAQVLQDALGAVTLQETGLSSSAKDQAGAMQESLDAFLESLNASGATLEELRAGQQVINDILSSDVTLTAAQRAEVEKLNQYVKERIDLLEREAKIKPFSFPGQRPLAARPSTLPDRAPTPNDLTQQRITALTEDALGLVSAFAQGTLSASDFLERIGDLNGKAAALGVNLDDITASVLNGLGLPSISDAISNASDEFQQLEDGLNAADEAAVHFIQTMSGLPDAIRPLIGSDSPLMGIKRSILNLQAGDEVHLRQILNTGPIHTEAQIEGFRIGKLFGDGLKKGVKETVSDDKGLFGDLLKNAIDLATSLGSIFAGKLEDGFKQLGSIAGKGLQALLPSIPGIGSVLEGEINKLVDGFKRLEEQVIGTNAAIADNFKSVIDGAKDFGKTYGGALDDLIAKGQQAADNASNFWTNLFNKGFANAQGQLAEEISSTIQLAEKLGQSIPSAIGDALFAALQSGDFDAAREELRQALYKSTIKTIIDTTVAAAVTTSELGDKLVALSGIIKNAIATGDWTGAQQAIRDLGSEATRVFDGVVNNLGPALSGFLPGSSGTGVQAAQGTGTVNLSIPTLNGVIAAPTWTVTMTESANMHLEAANTFLGAVRDFSVAVATDALTRRTSTSTSSSPQRSTANLR